MPSIRTCGPEPCLGCACGAGSRGPCSSRRWGAGRQSAPATTSSEARVRADWANTSRERVDIQFYVVGVEREKRDLQMLQTREIMMGEGNEKPPLLAGPPKSQSHYFEMHTSSKCSFWCIETFLLKKNFILRPPTMGPSMGPICTLLPLTVPYYIF